jgi:hemolysin activation/secretion protein
MKATLLPSVFLSLSIFTASFANAAPNASDISKDALTLPEPPKGYHKPLEITPEVPEIIAEDEDTVKVLVNEIQFVGNTVLTTDNLRAVLNAKLGHVFSFVGLQNLTKTITREYQLQGYLIAQAYLPVQDLKDGVLIIQINEGYVNEISVEQQGRFKKHLGERYLAPLKGPVLSSKLLERKILLLSDIAGNDVEVTLNASQYEGKTNLALRTYDTKRISGYIAADNAGNRFTGGERLSGRINLNNSLGYGERIGFSLASSVQGYQYASLDLALPIGVDGLVFDSEYAYTYYALQDEFKSLDANGNTHAFTMGLSYPLLRSLGDNIYTSASFKHQQLQDMLGQFNSDKEKTIDSLAVAAYGDHVNAAGDKINWRVELTGGSVNLDANEKANDVQNVDGHFSKLNIRSDYNHFLNDKWSLFLKGEGQLSSGNLDSNMKLSLGGSDLVRAYPQGETSVDNGVLTTLELRYQYSPSLQLAGFYDVGSGNEFKDPIIGADKGHKNLAGAGLKATWIANNWYVNSSVAWRNTGPSESDNRSSNPRAWIQLVRIF